MDREFVEINSAVDYESYEYAIVEAYSRTRIERQTRINLQKQ
jgi:hypothetical protein